VDELIAAVFSVSQQPLPPYPGTAIVITPVCGSSIEAGPAGNADGLQVEASS